MIELQRLRFFVVTCRHSSMADAAAELDIAVSTLSTGLRSLERELGTTLFRRARSRLLPTPAAQWLYRAASNVLLVEAFGHRLMRPSKRHEGTLLTVDIGLFAIGRGHWPRCVQLGAPV